jgi:hypothetical protein
MKYSHRRFAENRQKLEKELQGATEALLRGKPSPHLPCIHRLCSLAFDCAGLCMRHTAHENRSRVRVLFEQSEALHKVSAPSTLTQTQLERHSSKLEKAGREMKEAEHAYTMAERHRRALQTKHDVSIGRMLARLQYKEKRLGNTLRKALALIGALWLSYLSKTCAKADAALISAISTVDVYKDIRSVRHSRSLPLCRITQV